MATTASPNQMIPGDARTCSSLRDSGNQARMPPVKQPAHTVWGWALAAACVALGACGGEGRRRAPSSREVAPAAEVDLSGSLPPDAVLTATFRPGDLLALLGALGERNVGLRAGFERSDAGFLLDPGFLPAFGIDGQGPAWFSVRSGPLTGILQAAEDLARVFQAPEQFTRWVVENPLPAAWVHVRLVARRNTEPEVSPADWLGVRAGAVQMFAPSDGPEMWAAALDTTPAEAQAILGALGPLGDYRVALLLDAERPSAIVFVPSRSQITIDWVADAGLGRGGLLAGFKALTEPSTTAGPTGAGAAGGTDRVAGPPAKGETLRLTLAHAPWMLWSRAMAEIEVIGRALSDAQAPLEVRGVQMAQSRQAAALPQQLLGPGSLLFRSTRLSIATTPGDVRVRVEAAYTSRGAKLGALGDGQAPVAARSISGAGSAAITIAGSSRHGRMLDELAPVPALPLDRFLSESLHCGFVCWPALWVGFPSYARQPVASLATIFPEVAAFAEPLNGATGAVFIVETKPKPGVALAARYAGSVAEPQARWHAAVPGFERRIVANGPEPVLVVGNAPGPLDMLSRAIGGAPVPAEALIDADFQGPISSIFGRFSVRVVLGREGLEVDSRFQLLPLAPAPENTAP